VIGSDTHTQVNLEMARRSLVLLRNDGTMPLMPPVTDRAPIVAVVGPSADDQHAQLGDWAGASGQAEWIPSGHPRELTTTVLDGLRRYLPTGWQVVHERGAEVGTEEDDPALSTLPDGQPRPKLFTPAEPDPELLDAAVAAAKQADWVVAVLGDTVALTGEHKSTATLELQGAQIALLDALVETSTRVILVLIQSKPSVLPESALRASAIIEAFNRRPRLPQRRDRPHGRRPAHGAALRGR
jgi:beta-glucosidase